MRKLTELMMASVGFGASNDGGGGGSMDERLRKSTSRATYMQCIYHKSFYFVQLIPV